MPTISQKSLSPHETSLFCLKCLLSIQKKTKSTACLPANPAKKSKSTRDKSKITVKKSKSTARLPTISKKSLSPHETSLFCLKCLLSIQKKTKSTRDKSKRPSFETPRPLQQNGSSLPFWRPNLLQDCILQELKLMNRNIETLCQQRQYIFPSPTPVKVPVDINIHKIIESYETSKKEDYVEYDVKKQKMVKNAKRKSKNNGNQCESQHTDDRYREPIIAGRGKYGKVLENYKIPKKSKQTYKSSH